MTTGVLFCGVHISMSVLGSKYILPASTGGDTVKITPTILPSGSVRFTGSWFVWLYVTFHWFGPDMIGLMFAVNICVISNVHANSL